jgi:hypothetical protein
MGLGWRAAQLAIANCQLIIDNRFVYGKSDGFEIGGVQLVVAAG